MGNGNINEFVKRYKGINRAQLVSSHLISHGDQCYQFVQLVDAANGLDYMHSIHMVHGDLKGVWLN